MAVGLILKERGIDSRLRRHAATETAGCWTVCQSPVYIGIAERMLVEVFSLQGAQFHLAQSREKVHQPTLRKKREGWGTHSIELVKRKTGCATGPEKTEMTHRPFAIRLIAAYLLLKATVLVMCVLAVDFRPSVQSTANGIIEDLVPMIMGLKDSEMDIWLAPLFVVVDTVLGAGIWFLQSWARIIILIDLTWLFGRAAVGLMALALAHPIGVHFRPPSLFFAINVLVSLVMLGCLLDPDIGDAFRAGGPGADKPPH